MEPRNTSVTARVELAAGLDPHAWAARYDAGEVPDRTPYGLHRMAGHGVVPDLHTVVLTGPGGRLARSVRHRSGGLELVELARTPTRGADVVLAYDERTGVPAALREALRPPGRRTPVVTGIGWLTDPALTPRAEAVVARAALPHAARVWVQCRPMLPLLVRHWGVPRHRASFVPFGIDTDFYARQPQDPVPGSVFGAGEDRYRDHDLLVAAVRALRTGRPDVGLDLATGMATTFTPELGTLHTGRLDGRIRACYARASVVAVALRPTVTGSGLSVVLEAMASGRPVVVTDNPGIDDYVDHGRTGLRVPAGDVRALSAALGSLLDDPARARAMGERAAVDVRERFSSGVMASALAVLLRSAAGDGRASSVGSRRRHERNPPR